MNQMLAYTVILIALTLLPFAFGALGGTYLGLALLLDAAFLIEVLRVRLSTDWTARAWKLYKFSLLYLALLFAAMVIDRQLFFSRNLASGPGPTAIISLS